MVGPTRLLLAAGLFALVPLAPAGAQTCGLSPPQQSYIQRPLAPAYASIVGLGGTTQALAPCSSTAFFSVIPAPFPFTYFGQVKTLLRLQKNGFLHFTSYGGLATTPNVAIPDVAIPNDLVAPFWEVLIPAPVTGGLFFRTDGTAPNRVFTAEWRDMMILTAGPACFDNGSRLNFQAKLFEGENSIEFHYGPFNAGAVGASISATIGLENAGGTLAVNPAGLGTQNALFPATDLRFFPGAVSTAVPSYTASTAPSSFASIAGAPGATQVFCSAGGVCPPPTTGPCTDDEGAPINLTFPFSFWGEAKTSVQMSMNGIAAFDFSLGVAGAGNPVVPVPFPNAAIPNDWAAPWWDDLVADDPAPTTGGWWMISGSAGNQVLTMEWTNLSIFDPITNTSCTDTGDRINCQLEFHEAGNLVVCKYGAQVLGAGPNTASVGVENKTGTVAVDGTGLGPNNSIFPTTDIVFAPCNLLGLVLPFGNGCAGSLGAPPTIGSSGGPATIGNASFALTMSGGPPSSSLNGLILGASGSQWLIFNLPMSVGILGFPAACSLFASIDTLLSPVVTDPAGSASVSLPIPNVGSLVGGSAFVEFFSITPTLATTSGAEVRIG
ncbi:MAG TPA: hypothetical protein VFI25_03585 [Planctomycetota bacterium]|jgi:hypothetical protein|nr:hypothetical protein [Planctomycetota bacterium]